MKRSLACHDFNSTYASQFLDDSSRNKKVKYSDPISLSPDTFRNEHSKPYRHMQSKDPHLREHYANSRKRVIQHKTREQNYRTPVDESRHSKNTNSFPKALYPELPKRHSSNKYAPESPRSTHYSSPAHISSRSHNNKVRSTEQRDRSFQRKVSPLDDVKYHRRNPSHVEFISSPLYQRKEKDLQSYHCRRQRHPEKRSSRNVLEQDLRYNSESIRNRSLEAHESKREDSRKYREKYVIVEDSANFRTSKNHPTSHSEDKWRSQKLKEERKADDQLSRRKRSYSPRVSRMNSSIANKEE